DNRSGQEGRGQECHVGKGPADQQSCRPEAGGESAGHAGGLDDSRRDQCRDAEADGGPTGHAGICNGAGFVEHTHSENNGEQFVYPGSACTTAAADSSDPGAGSTSGGAAESTAGSRGQSEQSQGTAVRGRCPSAPEGRQSGGGPPEGRRGAETGCD